ncbi:MAG: hypothetical protein KDA84_17140, partial [Planctomycetaceae bacterium]|nr:hypothetical protein [Planctomycetaceae bacterium]
NCDRAEFIRIQCELVHLPENAPHRPALLKREKALLKKYAKQWAKPFRDFIQLWTFHRGFLESAVVTTKGMGDQFVPRFQQLIDATPLRGIAIDQEFGEPKVLLPAAPLMTGLREFGIWRGHLYKDGKEYRKLFHSPHLSGLTTLDLVGLLDSSWFRPRTLSAILKSPVLSNLTTLLVSDYRNELHSTVLSAIAKSPSLTNLKHLGIRITSFDQTRIRAFSRAPFAQNLETLELQYCDLDQDAWRELLSDKAFPNLKHLFLSGARIGGIEMQTRDQDSKSLRDQVKARFGSGALYLKQEFPHRPQYYSWWDK